jgi:peptide-methionine (S)-S-oxide reductase
MLRAIAICAVLGGILMISWFGDSATPLDAHAAGIRDDFPEPVLDAVAEKQLKSAKAVLAGGCFWCTEAVFKNLTGVSRVTSGYAGGTASTADYRTVSSGSTDHAEVIEVVYDPKVIGYGQILRVFFSIAHDPTQLNRQGADVGRQYRSAVFYTSDEQRVVTEAYIAQLEKAKVFDRPIVTVVEKLDKFYRAEDYHQDFVNNNPNQGYVRAVALPKVEKLKKTFPEMLKDKQNKK